MPRTPKEPVAPRTSRFTQAVAEELRQANGREGRKQAWLAAVIGRNQTYAGRVLRGLVAPSTDELALLCEALNEPLAPLISRAEAKSADPGWTPTVPSHGAA